MHPEKQPRRSSNRRGRAAVRLPPVRTALPSNPTPLSLSSLSPIANAPRSIDQMNSRATRSCVQTWGVNPGLIPGVRESGRTSGGGESVRSVDDHAPVPAHRHFMQHIALCACMVCGNLHLGAKPIIPRLLRQCGAFSCRRRWKIDAQNAQSSRSGGTILAFYWLWLMGDGSALMSP